MAERDLRKAQRIAAELPMKLTFASGHAFIIKRWDFSSNGVFLDVNDDILALAIPNDIVEVQFQGTNHRPPVMSAQIIRITEKGLALSLKDTLIEGDAEPNPSSELNTD